MSSASEAKREDVKLLMDNAWEKIQRKTFRKWVNTYLRQRKMALVDLTDDLSDGIKLLNFLEVISGEKAGKYDKKPKMRIQKMQNLYKAMNFIDKVMNVKLVAIGAEDIIDQKIKLILGMIWTIIQKYQINDITEEELTAKEALLLWCKKKTKNYKHVDPPGIKNFTTSWKDGLAFCALIHKHRPDLLDYSKLSPSDPAKNLQLAFDVAEKHLGIAPLLDVEDLLDVPKPDERSVITYVSQYYHVFASSAKEDEAANRIGKLVDLTSQIQEMKDDYSKRAKVLADWIKENTGKLDDRTMGDLEKMLKDLEDFKNKDKPPQTKEKLDLEALFNSINLKLKNNNRPIFAPDSGLSTKEIQEIWDALEKAERDREAWLRQTRKDKKKLAAKKNAFDAKAAALAKWIEQKQGYLNKDEPVDSVLTAMTKLKILDGFNTEYKESKPRLDTVIKLGDECIALGSEDADAINATKTKLSADWSGLEPLAGGKKKRLDEKLEKEKKKEELRLKFAKLAKEYQDFIKKSLNTLSDTNFGRDLASVEGAGPKVEATGAKINGDSEAKKSELDKLWADMKDLGVEDNKYSPVTPEDIAKLHGSATDAIAKRKEAYDKELERQKMLEEKRKEFAKLADEFVVHLGARKDGFAALSGEPEDVTKALNESYADGAAENAKLEPLEALNNELLNLGVRENQHTKFTMPDLIVKNKELAAWVANFRSNLLEERELKEDYNNRAKALITWISEVKPTLKKDSDNTLEGASARHAEWNEYKTGPSVEHEIEKLALKSLATRISKLMAANKRGEFTPAEAHSGASIDAAWKDLSEAEDAAEKEVNDELDRQQRIAVLLRRFNNEASALESWISGKEAYVAEDVKITSLTGARYSARVLSIFNADREKKAAQLPELDTLRASIAELKYKDSATTDAKYAELVKRLEALKTGTEGKKAKIDSSLEDQNNKEKLRGDYASAAQNYRRFVRQSLATIENVTFGHDLKSTEAFKEKLDASDAEFAKNNTEQKAIADKLSEQLKAAGVTENKYTTLGDADLIALEKSLNDAIAKRQTDYAASLETQKGADGKRKEWAEFAKEYLAWIESQRAEVEKIEGTPDERMAKANEIYQAGKPAQEKLDAVVAKEDEMEKAGIYGNPYTDLTCDLLTTRKGQFDTSVTNFLSGLEGDKALAARAAATAADFAKREKVQNLIVEYGQKAQEFSLWQSNANELLTEGIDVETAEDVAALQKDFDDFVSAQATAKTNYEKLLALAGDLKAAGSDDFSGVPPETVTANWEAIQGLIATKKTALVAAAEGQKTKDAAKADFEAKAASFRKFIDAQRAALSSVKGDLDAQIKTLNEINATITSGKGQLVGLEEADEKCSASAVTTAVSFAELKVAFAQLVEGAKKQIDTVQQEKLRKEGSTLSAEQLGEYKDVFNHFDKDGDGKIDNLEFSGVLQALGDDMTEEQVASLLVKLDHDKDGRLSFQEFIPYMEEKAKGADSKSEIIASFKILAGDKEFITDSDLGKAFDEKKAAYLKSVMPKHPTDGYDYVKWAETAFAS